MARQTCFALEQEDELRVQGKWDSDLRLRLISGTAEIFGTDISHGEWLKFPPGEKLAVFTWIGATIEVQGPFEAIYVAKETPMRTYWDVQSMLENKRAKATEAACATSGSDVIEGPKVIVVGPMDSGKSSLTRMLLGWASKKGHRPVFADVDLGQGSLTIPGSIAATLVHEPVHPVDGIPLETPLVYFYGHTTPSVNSELYKSLVKELAKSSRLLLEKNPNARAAGIVINTMGWVKDLGYELLVDTIESFGANIVLVLGQEELYKSLTDEFGGRSGRDVLLLPRSDGVIVRDPKSRQLTRTSRTREYFYGLFNSLFPQQGSIRFAEAKIFQFGGPYPLDALAYADPTHPVPVRISQDLVQSVLAISYAKEPGQLLSSKRIWYVAPCSGSLPNNLLLKGSLTWREF